MVLDKNNEFQKFIDNAKTNITQVTDESAKYIIHLPKTLDREMIGEDFSNGKEIELENTREIFNNENKL